MEDYRLRVIHSILLAIHKPSKVSVKMYLILYEDFIYIREANI